MPQTNSLPRLFSARATADYELTGWYDDFTGAAGGAIRIVIAVPRETE
ncbi:MAG: hypothetical protein IJU66_00345 [Oscillospiraceae bacterium]|nr:hypothetical protein [Oscillospiraceae bacterium]